MESPKRRKLNNEDSNNLVWDIELLPNEILMKIFFYFDIKELWKCAQVSKKFRQISHDKSFWKCVNLYKQRVSCQFVAQIIQLGTKYLNLHRTIILGDGNAVIPGKNDLKYLNLASSLVKDNFLVRLLRSSVSLEKIAIGKIYQKNIKFKNLQKMEHDQLKIKLQRSWYIECLLPNAKMLTTLDLRNTYGMINSESLEEILINCVELKEANFKGQISDLESFVKNVTPKIEKLNISYNGGFVHTHIVSLVKRCNNITELDLYGCHLDKDSLQWNTWEQSLVLKAGENQNSLIAISENLSQSLVKLQLPDHSFLYHKFLKSLPKLGYLWNKSKTTTMIMEKYPRIVLNEGTAKIAHCANEFFEPEQGFWEVKCAAVDFSKTQ